MRFLSLIASAALAAVSVAQGTTQIGFTQVPTTVTTGSSYKLQWNGGDSSSPVTIALRKGNADSIKTIQILTTDATGNSFNWTPISSLVDGTDYSLQITQGLNSINFSGQIEVTGGIDPVSASISSILASASSAIASANATLSQLAPITSMTGSSTTSGGSAAGTGTASPRNSTFSSATLGSTATSTAVKTTTAAGSTAAGSSASASSTGGADAMSSGYSSPMALFCAILAAIAYAI